jgi:hypothetical protein
MRTLTGGEGTCCPILDSTGLFGAIPLMGLPDCVVCSPAATLFGTTQFVWLDRYLMGGNILYEQVQTAQSRLWIAQKALDNYVNRPVSEVADQSRFRALCKTVEVCNEEYLYVVDQYLKEKYPAPEEPLEPKHTNDANSRKLA